MRIFTILTLALGVMQASLYAQLPDITNQPASQTVLIGSNVTFTVGVSGPGPFYYQWLFNSNTISTNNIITTVAGGGTGGLGDGGAATNASINYAGGVAVNASGNIFIVDSIDSRIRKVDTNGIITTVAGNGSATFSGDGGAATNASLNNPNRVAVDPSGNLLIADSSNNRVRKVDTNGIITTIVGGGAGGGTDGLGDGGAATNATLSIPLDMAFDSSANLFIADDHDNRVRKVSTNGVITTVAGGGTGGGTDGLGDGGAATNASLNNPCGTTLDVFGNLFIADCNNNRIRKVDTNGIIAVFAGGGAGGGTDGIGDGGLATNAILNGPNTIILDAFGNLLIADYGNNRIRKVSTNGIITTVAGGGAGGGTDGLGDGGPATNATLNNPASIAADSAGNLFIADAHNSRIRKVAVHYNGAPTLTLTNVTTNNAGYYQVIVTSPYGSVTSHLALLTIYVPPRTAASVALETNGFVYQINITDPGYGYTNAPAVHIIGGGGSGVQVAVLVSNGMVTAVKVVNAGSGYTNAPLVVIDPPIIPNPFLSLSSVSILAVTNLAIGSNYQLQQTFQWYWTNQDTSFTATNSSYTQGISVANASNASYRLALAPVPAQAFATPQVLGGYFIGATLTSGGSGYTTAPTVNIVGGGGTGATAVAQMSAGVVTNIQVINTGSGYNTPMVEIAPPPVVAVLPTVSPGIRLDSTNLVPYDNYEVQSTPDFTGGWANSGFFSPTNVINSQYIMITNGAGFFRIEYMP